MCVPYYKYVQQWSVIRPWTRALKGVLPSGAIASCSSPLRPEDRKAARMPGHLSVPYGWSGQLRDPISRDGNTPLNCICSVRRQWKYQASSTSLLRRVYISYRVCVLGIHKTPLRHGWKHHSYTTDNVSIWSNNSFTSTPSAKKKLWLHT